MPKVHTQLHSVLVRICLHGFLGTSFNHSTACPEFLRDWDLFEWISERSRACPEFHLNQDLFAWISGRSRACPQFHCTQDLLCVWHCETKVKRNLALFFVMRKDRKFDLESEPPLTRRRVGWIFEPWNTKAAVHPNRKPKLGLDRGDLTANRRTLDRRILDLYLNKYNLSTDRFVFMTGLILRANVQVHTCASA